MAKNIFMRGEYKRLYEKIRRYKKNKQRLATKLLAYAKEENFSAFNLLAITLTKQRSLLELEKSRLNQIKLSLQNKQAEL